jgi:hypothetical protein
MMTNEKPVAAMMTGEKPAPDAGLRRVVRANVITVVFEVIVPMVLFYGLRAAGVSQWWALMAGVLVAAPYVGWTVARNRRVDLVALFTPCCWPTRWRTSCSSTRCRSISSPWSPPWSGSPRWPA